MIDHLTISVVNFAGTLSFFTKALEPLGYGPLMQFENYAGFGDRKPYLWIKEAPQATQPMHLAFQAANREQVDAFYSAAIAAGARDDGAPGVRDHYHPNYYGAFVIDPINGHPIEAVCHHPPTAKAAAKKKLAAKRVVKATKARTKKSRR